MRFKVSGMTCDHCVSAVTRALKAVPGVQKVVVDLAGGEVEVGGAPDERAVRKAIVEEGYEVS